MNKVTVKVKVPATSANLGPGFDVLGLALHFFNDVTFEVSGGWSTKKIRPVLGFTVEGEGETSLPRDASNLVFQAALAVFENVKRWPRELRITLVNRIPLSRGLGSSAAATLGGLCAANALTGKKLSTDALLQFATEMEGHPDNVVPALVGGFCVSALVKGAVHYVKFPVPAALRAVVCSPDRPLATLMARAVLPKQLSMADAVQTSSRAAFLVAAFVQKRYAALDFAMDDVLHQPARAKLIPGFNEAMAAAKTAGAWGTALSGAGSTVLAFAKPTTAARVGKAMQQAFKRHRERSQWRSLSLNNNGVRYL